MICSGNICRSPYARTYLSTALEQAGIRDIEVDSAGFFGPDRPAHERGSQIARQRGVDLDYHRSRVIRASDATEFDLLFVMTRRHRKELIRLGIAPERIALLGDFDVADPPEREIVDPYGQSDAVFERVFGQIERSVQGFCEILLKVGPAASP
ncbi:MAG: low molecular weight protein-tyrosine-phosphatase [Gemmatimonadales bacterium]